MADLRDYAVTQLSSTSGVDMQTGAKVALYTVPLGKACIVTHVIVRNPTAGLDGSATDYDFGDGVNADTWLQAVDLQTMTLTSNYYIIESNNIKYVVFDAGDAFGVKAIDGSDDPATATIEVFGYLYDV